jgi:hypothetical protein
MFYKKTTYRFIILIGISILFRNCGNDETTLSNDELIFSNSFEIHISGYEYVDEMGRLCVIQGDTTYALIPDTVSGRPLLAWDSISTPYVTVALFRRPIVVLGGEIKNVEDVLWQWHSGMDFGKDGFVQFSQGANVYNGVIDYENLPLSLAEGHYYWAVWAWGTAGIRILFSSRQREIYVLN